MSIGNPTLNTLLAKSIYTSPFRKYLLPKYKYSFTPQQLFFMCECVRSCKDVEGSIVEIGCSKGHTTIFLNNFLNEE